jgi:hypothetical protein
VKPPRQPLMQLGEILALPPRLRLDVAVLLSSTLECEVPSAILLDALSILCLNQLPLTRVEEVARLPLYCVPVITSAVKDTAMRRIRRDTEKYNEVSPRPPLSGGIGRRGQRGGSGAISVSGRGKIRRHVRGQASRNEDISGVHLTAALTTFW